MKDNIKKRLEADLMIFEINEIKPNYAAIARKYGMDYRTVKKYMEGGTTEKSKTRNKASRLDDYYAEIQQKLLIPRVTRKGVYEYLVDKYTYDVIGTYSNFKAYCKKHQLAPVKPTVSNGGSTRFEVEPGELAEADWKEDITLTSKDGTSLTFNIFHLVLKFSRFSYIELTLSKDQPTVFRCLINAFKFYGGVPKRILFDNMTTIMDVNVNPKRVNLKAEQFAKDMNFIINACKARHAYTKGTNEARNKILDWIRTYDNDFETFDDLHRTVYLINKKMNLEICEGTDLPPVLLFAKEKEHLSPLVSQSIIDQYLSGNKYRVDPQQLVRYKGSKYSVDKSYINEYVEIEEINDMLQIYYNGFPIQVHKKTNNLLNYTEEHYRQSLEKTIKKEDMDEVVKRNLAIMDQLAISRSVEITIKDACKSDEALTAYLISHGSLSNYIKRYIESLTKEKTTILYRELKKLLPYVKDEEDFFNSFKDITKNLDDLNYIRADYYIYQNLGSISMLTKEGYKAIYGEFKDYIKGQLEEIRKGWE